MERSTKHKKFYSILDDLVRALVEALSGSPWGSEVGKALVPAPVRNRSSFGIEHIREREASFAILESDHPAVPSRQPGIAAIVSGPGAVKKAMKVKTSLRAGGLYFNRCETLQRSMESKAGKRTTSPCAGTGILDRSMPAGRWGGFEASIAMTAAVVLFGAGLAEVRGQDPDARPSRPNAFIALLNPESSDLRDAIREVRHLGGRIDHAFPPDAMIVYLPAGAEGRISPDAPALRIERGPASEAGGGALGDAGRFALRVWNESLAGKGSRRAAGKSKGPPGVLLDDARRVPSTAHLPSVEKAAGGQDKGFYQTSEFLIGTVAIAIVMPESDGSVDPSTENWDEERQAKVVARILEGLQWWKDNVHAPEDLAFSYEIRRGVPTVYEPITRKAKGEEGFWISDVMDRLGYPGANHFYQVYSYLNHLRAELRTDWAYTIFVADSLQDDDGMFPDGYFAYAHFYGPFSVMTYDNEGWGIDRMHMVTAHEAAHIFGALDEYASSGCHPEERGGYLDIPNRNCENGWPAEDCIMRSATSQELAWPYHHACTITRHMLGWRDSKGYGDGLYDPEDTTPEIEITGPEGDRALGAPTAIAGSARDVPFPSPTRKSVTINRIRDVRWRIDGGPWRSAAPGDGAFDSAREEFALRLEEPLSPGDHIVEAWAVNSIGSSSPPAVYRFSIIPPEDPDLVVSDLVWSPVPGYGGSFAVVETTRNLGPGPANLSRTRFYLSRDCALDAADIEMGMREVPPLAPGEASSGAAEITIPGGSCSGIHFVIASADADSEVSEGEESNNARKLRVLVSDGGGSAKVPEEGLVLRRGDVNLDGRLDLGDVLTVIEGLLGGDASWCPESADSDGSGAVDLADPLHVLKYLFRGGPVPAVVVEDCGED